MAEFRCINKAQISTDIFLPRRRSSNETPNIISIGIAAIGNISSLVEKDNAVNQSIAICIEQTDFLAAGIEPEIRREPEVRKPEDLEL